MGKIFVDSPTGKSLDLALQAYVFESMTDDMKTSILATRFSRQFPDNFPPNNGGNPLNKINVMLLARILDCGYYYDLTPEEGIARTYRDKREIQNATRDHKTLFESEAFANGILFTIKTLGLNIKGVEKE